MVEEGSHAELLAKKGLYYTLVTYQQDVQVNILLVLGLCELNNFTLEFYIICKV